MSVRGGYVESGETAAFPTAFPKTKPSSTQSSPVLIKKASNPRRYSADMQARHVDQDFALSFLPNKSDSPKRRTLKFANSSPNRRSAGARLCKVFEEDALSLSDEGTDSASDRPNSHGPTASLQI